MRAFAALALAGSAACLVGVLPALAADQSVEAKDSFFDPDVVALMPGDTLTITHAGNQPHALRFDDEGRERQSGGVGWTETRTFGAGEARAEPYVFRCDLHAGMTGEVYVNATGTVPTPTSTPTPTPTATRTATPTPTATPPGGGGGGGGGGTSGGGGTAGGGGGTTSPGGGGSSAPAELRSLRLAGTSFCTRRSSRCRRPGVRMRIDLSAAAPVTATLSRRARPGARYRRFGMLDFGRVAAGPRVLSFTRTKAGRRLTAARYRLVVRAAGSTRTLSFAVR